MATPSTSIGQTNARRRTTTRIEVTPLIPTSAPWILGLFLGLPVFLVILLHDPNSPVSIGEHYFQIVINVSVIGGPLYSFYVWVMPRLFLRMRSRIARLALHASSILAADQFGRRLAVALCIRLGIEPGVGRGLIWETLVSTGIATSVVLISTTYARIRREHREAKIRENEARQTAVVAQLKALQLRTNPHFLFNSLNTVASLIGTDPVKAEDTLVRLAGLFRYALEGSQRPSVSIGEEIEAVRDYLELEGLRLGQRLKWELDVDDALDEIRIPPLLLQPLVDPLGDRPAEHRRQEVAFLDMRPVQEVPEVGLEVMAPA